MRARDGEALALLAQRRQARGEQGVEALRAERGHGAELVAAEAIGLPAGERRREAPAEPGQESIAGRVSEGVVVALEAVEVEHDEAEGRLGGGLGGGGGEVGPQLAPVAQAGEAVGVGLVAQLVVCGLPLAPAARGLHEQQRDERGQDQPAAEDRRELHPARASVWQAHPHRPGTPAQRDALGGRRTGRTLGPEDRLTRVRDLEARVRRQETQDRGGEPIVTPGPAREAAQGGPPLGDGPKRSARSIDRRHQNRATVRLSRSQLNRGAHRQPAAVPGGGKGAGRTAVHPHVEAERPVVLGRIRLEEAQREVLRAVLCGTVAPVGTTVGDGDAAGALEALTGGGRHARRPVEPEEARAAELDRREARELDLLDLVRRREQPPHAHQGGARLGDLVVELPRRPLRPPLPGVALPLALVVPHADGDDRGEGEHPQQDHDRERSELTSSGARPRFGRHRFGIGIPRALNEPGGAIRRRRPPRGRAPRRGRGGAGWRRRARPR